MRLKELGRYKENSVLKLINSENIIKAIVNKTESFLDTPISIEPTSLVYKNIFPYKKVPNIEEETDTYITMSTGRFRLVNNTFKAGYITFYVFTHDSLMKTSYGMTRVDYILSEIDELFNKSSDVGGSNLKYDDMDEFDIGKYYSGYWIRYKAMDFN